MSAAREYKAVVDGLSEAAADLREQDAERATALGYRRVGEHDAMTEAAGRAGLTRMVVSLHWETALERLWQESWLTLRPPPAPTPDVAPAGLDALDAEVARCADALQEATRRRRFGLRPR